MLGLGLKRKGIFSGAAPVVDSLGNFTLSDDLIQDVIFFRITAKKIGHNNDATHNDNDPKVILSNLVVKVNDTVSSEYNLNSTYVLTESNYYHIAYISPNSLSIEDNTTSGFFYSDRVMYNDNTTNFSAVATDKIEVSGNIKLADGTAYNPDSNSTQGRIEFTFNNHSGSGGGKLQVFLDPNYNSGAVGTVGAHTTVSS